MCRGFLGEVADLHLPGDPAGLGQHGVGHGLDDPDISQRRVVGVGAAQRRLAARARVAGGASVAGDDHEVRELTGTGHGLADGRRHGAGHGAPTGDRHAGPRDRPARRIVNTAVGGLHEVQLRRQSVDDGGRRLSSGAGVGGRDVVGEFFTGFDQLAVVVLGDAEHRRRGHLVSVGAAARRRAARRGIDRVLAGRRDGDEVHEHAGTSHREVHRRGDGASCGAVRRQFEPGPGDGPGRCVVGATIGRRDEHQLCREGVNQQSLGFDHRSVVGRLDVVGQDLLGHHDDLVVILGHHQISHHGGVGVGGAQRRLAVLRGGIAWRHVGVGALHGGVVRELARTLHSESHRRRHGAGGGAGRRKLECRPGDGPRRGVVGTAVGGLHEVQLSREVVDDQSLGLSQRVGAVGDLQLVGELLARGDDTLVVILDDAEGDAAQIDRHQRLGGITHEGPVVDRARVAPGALDVVRGRLAPAVHAAGGVHKLSLQRRGLGARTGDLIEAAVAVVLQAARHQVGLVVPRQQVRAHIGTHELGDLDAAAALLDVGGHEVDLAHRGGLDADVDLPGRGHGVAVAVEAVPGPGAGLIGSQSQRRKLDVNRVVEVTVTVGVDHAGHVTELVGEGRRERAGMGQPVRGVVVDRIRERGLGVVGEHPLGGPVEPLRRARHGLIRRGEEQPVRRVVHRRAVHHRLGLLGLVLRAHQRLTGAGEHTLRCGHEVALDAHVVIELGRVLDAGIGQVPQGDIDRVGQTRLLVLVRVHPVGPHPAGLHGARGGLGAHRPLRDRDVHLLVQTKGPAVEADRGVRPVIGQGDELDLPDARLAADGFQVALGDGDVLAAGHLRREAADRAGGVGDPDLDFLVEDLVDVVAVAVARLLVPGGRDIQRAVLLNVGVEHLAVAAGQCSVGGGGGSHGRRRRECRQSDQREQTATGQCCGGQRCGQASREHPPAIIQRAKHRDTPSLHRVVPRGDPSHRNVRQAVQWPR